MRLTWKENHPEMEFYEPYTKDSDENGIEFMSVDHNDTVPDTALNHNFESWSLVLYLVCFLLIIIFFVMISAMEVCCKRRHVNVPPLEDEISEVSPPAYDEFAPPAYDSLYAGTCQKKEEEKKKLRVFVIDIPKRMFKLDSTGPRDENTSENSIEVQDDSSPPPPP